MGTGKFCCSLECDRTGKSCLTCPVSSSVFAGWVPRVSCAASSPHCGSGNCRMTAPRRAAGPGTSLSPLGKRWPRGCWTSGTCAAKASRTIPSTGWWPSCASRVCASAWWWMRLTTGFMPPRNNCRTTCDTAMCFWRTRPRKRASTSPDSASSGSKPSMSKSARTPRSCPWADVSPCRRWHPAGSSRCFRRSQVAWRWATMSPNRRIACLPPEDQGRSGAAGGIPRRGQ